MKQADVFGIQTSAVLDCFAVVFHRKYVPNSADYVLAMIELDNAAKVLNQMRHPEQEMLYNRQRSRQHERSHTNVQGGHLRDSRRSDDALGLYRSFTATVNGYDIALRLHTTADRNNVLIGDSLFS